MKNDSRSGSCVAGGICIGLTVEFTGLVEDDSAKLTGSSLVLSDIMLFISELNKKKYWVIRLCMLEK